jgi:hypothetical protein
MMEMGTIVKSPWSCGALVKHSLSTARIGSFKTGAVRLSMREQLKLTGLLAFIVIMYIVGGYLDA